MLWQGLFLAFLIARTTAKNAKNEQEFDNWLKSYNVQAGEILFTEVDASWNYETNITKENEDIKLAAQGNTANFTKTMYSDMKKFKRSDLTSPKFLRVFDKLSKIGDSALEPGEFAELAQLKVTMESTYSTAKICLDPKITNISNCQEKDILNLDPEITAIMDSSRDPELLLHVWKAWRDASGKNMRDNYVKYIKLKNDGAKANGYKNAGEAWRAPYAEPAKNYTDANFLAEINVLWNQMKPLYEHLHAYVRGKLRQQYKDFIAADGPIPAHLLGNMWAQTWLGVLNFTQLYPSRPTLDVTAAMVANNFTALKMFELSDKFFGDLGLDKMPKEFWAKSLIEKPNDGRDVVCHASAWDFYNARDFRIKQCTAITMQDLFTVHHEMGHIEYFLLYKDQWITFRDGANDGFHEAIGDTLALSVSTPKHLSKIGLLPANSNTSDIEMDLNFMFSTALEKIAFLPFGLLMDMYRYEVFEGVIGTDELNAKWWEKLVTYQGICSPVKRTENDFDPGAKFHIPADVPYMRYFVSFIIQFQFHEALCNKAGHKGPLYTCDIDGSKEAGTLMRQALSKGSSEPWQDVMKVLTGQEKMDAGPLMRFFEPLLNHLKMENKKLGNIVGWTKNSECGAKPDVRDFLENIYPPQAEEIIYEAQEASWTYNTNITDTNEQIMNSASTINAVFDKSVAEVLKKYDISTIQDIKVRRLYNKLVKLGDAGLTAEKFTELLENINRMSKIYNTAKVCNDSSITDISKCPKLLNLEPEITQALATSRDPDYLLYLWRAWRDQSGKLMRDDYRQYVQLKNEAAKLDGYSNTAEAWRAPYVEPSHNYADSDFLNDVKAVWKELQPFYEELHAYIRHKLIKQYQGTSAKLKPNGPIPAHLLGNMWAQTWGNLLSFTVPNPNKTSLDVTSSMVAQKYNPEKMFRISDKFFTDLGLEKMPEEFWAKSLIEKPTDGRDVVCHASAWDFYNRKDFRIKQCTDITMEDLLTVHHEMGHVEYYLLYKNQPVPFRRGANDGFHEAVGDTLALSVSTPSHLKKIKLLPNETVVDKDMDLNFMFNTALDKIAFLPFGLMLDMYRYDVFSGVIKPDEYNTKWWEYVNKYQGLCAPVERSVNDFDPGSKYHVPADVPYMRYFVSFIIQFQFHKALCNAAGHTGELYKCDIDGSQNAGKLLREGLQLGASEPWQNAMKKLTGGEKMSAGPLLEFFGPLRDWLQEYIKNNNVAKSWSSEPYCPQTSGTATTCSTTKGFLQLMVLAVLVLVLQR